MLRRAVALVVVALLLSACGEERTVSAPVNISTPTKGHVRSDRKALVSMQVSGAETVSIEPTETVLHFEEIHGNEVPKVTWFLSVSAVPTAAIKDDRGRMVIFSADLSPGLYQGSGRTYTLSNEAATNVMGKSGIASASYVTFITLKPEPAERRFGLLAEPCTMKVGRDLVTGDVRCPKLTNAKGDAVELRWRWELV